MILLGSDIPQQDGDKAVAKKHSKIRNSGTAVLLAKRQFLTASDTR